MTTATPTTAVPGPVSSPAGKYFTFTLGQESYGIPVTKVREIIRLAPTTFVPQMPHYVKGVINLRGRVIPILDLRLKFQLAGIQDTPRTCIVVVKVEARAGQSTVMGLIVDAVEEVSTVAATDLEPAPDFGAQLDTAYLVGVAKVRGAVKMLLDIDRVIAAEQLACWEEVIRG